MVGLSQNERFHTKSDMFPSACRTEPDQAAHGPSARSSVTSDPARARKTASGTRRSAEPALEEFYTIHIDAYLLH